MTATLALLAGIGSVMCFANLRREFTDGECLSLICAGFGLMVLAVWLAMEALKPVLWP